MIFVECDDGDMTEFEAASRFSTDEHNNLEIWGGPEGDRLLQVFGKGVWRTVGASDGED